MSYFDFEKRMMVWIERRRVCGITLFLHMITILFDFWGWLIGFGLLWGFGAQGLEVISKQMLFIATCKYALGAWAITMVLKFVVRRKRPAQVIENYVVIGPAPSNSSFPSSHSSTIISFTLGLYFVGHPFFLWFAICAFLVLISRYYLGAHFPSDIGGGIIVGVIMAFVVKIMPHLG